MLHASKPQVEVFKKHTIYSRYRYLWTSTGIASEG